MTLAPSKNELFPDIKIPYYIYAPSYTHTSSGVRVLHLLCHILNNNGQKAFLCPDNGAGYAIHPELDTPILTAQYENFYNSAQIHPIVVYPDVVEGNPFNAKKIVRYFLAEINGYGRKHEIFPTDKVYGYCSHIYKKTLCLPTFDYKIFCPAEKKRNGTCFYSNKYERYGNKLLDKTANSTRLQGMPQEIAKILQESTVCYVYEMSEIIVLAQLCGCRVEIIETEFFKGIPNDWDFGGLEYDNPLANLKKLQEWTQRFWIQYEVFIADTQGEWK